MHEQRGFGYFSFVTNWLMKLMEQELYVIHYSLISRPWEQKRSILTSSLSMPDVVSSCTCRLYGKERVNMTWLHDIRKSDVIKQDSTSILKSTYILVHGPEPLICQTWNGRLLEVDSSIILMLSLEITFFILLLMQHLIRIVDITVLDRLSSEMSSRHLADDSRVISLLSSSLI